MGDINLKCLKLFQHHLSHLLVQVYMAAPRPTPDPSSTRPGTQEPLISARTATSSTGGSNPGMILRMIHLFSGLLEAQAVPPRSHSSTRMVHTSSWMTRRLSCRIPTPGTTTPTFSTLINQLELASLRDLSFIL